MEKLSLSLKLEDIISSPIFKIGKEITSLKDNFGDFGDDSESTTDIVKKSLGNLSDNFLELFDVLNYKDIPFFEKAKGFFDSIISKGKELINFLPKIKSGLNIEDISFFKINITIDEGIFSGLSHLKNKVVDLYDTFKLELTDFANIINSSIILVVKKIVKEIHLVVSSIISVINSVAKGTVSIVDKIPPIIDALFRGIVSIVEQISPMIEAITPIIDILVRGIVSIVEQISPMIEAITPIVESVINGITTIIGQITPVIETIVQSLTPFIGQILNIIEMVKTWSIVQSIFNIIMALNPITLIVIAVTALIGVIIIIVSKIKGWGTLWKGIVGFMKHSFKAFIEGTKLLWIKFTDGFMIGINKIRKGWYKFKLAMGLGDKSENEKALKEINEDTENRKKSIHKQENKVLEENKKAKKYIDSIDMSFGGKKGNKSGAGFINTITKLMGGGNNKSLNQPNQSNPNNKNTGVIKETNNSIITGGKKATNIIIEKINIAEGIQIITKELEQGVDEIKEIVVRSLLETLNSINKVNV